MSDAAIIPLADPEFWQDPYPLISRLREEEIRDRANGIFEVLMAFVTHLYEDYP